jgi:hypothetical protein
MSKNKINILACHETKRNTAYIDDLIINEHNMQKKLARNHQSQRGIIQIFCVNTFGVLQLCFL